MAKKKQTIADKIFEEYERIKFELGHVPSRMDLFNNMDADIYLLCMKNSKFNPFRQYLDYRHKRQDLPEGGEYLYHSLARDFLHELETTAMTKVYKMPILYAFYNHGAIRKEITKEQALTEWKNFFQRNKNWRDLKHAITYEKYLAISEQEHIRHIQSMPVKHLQGGFFYVKPGTLLALQPEIIPFLNNQFLQNEMHDILAYRTADYYFRRYHSH